MEGSGLLSEKEARRVYVMELVVKDGLTTRQGAELLGLNRRRVRRLEDRWSAGAVIRPSSYRARFSRSVRE